MPECPYAAKPLADFIEEKVHSGQYPAGFRLDSLRSLSAQFGLDVGAVRRALDHLAGKGIVEKRQGSGCYVRKKASRPACAASRKLAVFLGSESLALGVYSTVMLGLQRAASERDVRLLQSFNFSAATPEKANEALSECDGAVLLGADEYGDLYKKLSLRAPLVAVCSHDGNGGALSLVDIDPFECARQALGHFKAKGVSKALVVSHHAPAFMSRGRIFSALWGESGGDCEFVGVSQEIPKLRKGDGCLFTSGGAMQQWCRAFKERHGRALPDSFPILGIDGKNRIDPSYEKAPSISVDWQMAGRYALEECLYRIENPGAVPKRIYLPGKLYE